MSAADPSAESTRSREARFATTLWSVVQEAKEGTESKAAEALARLCQVYWYPLYFYVRRRGYNQPDAEDLVQGFFAQILAHLAIQRVTPARGRFRSFLLASLNHFLSDQRDRARAQKRGGGQETISFEAMDAEGRYRLEPVDERTPEQLFERRWALTVLEQVLARLEQEYTASNKREQFEELRPFLLGDRSHGTYAEAASRRGVSEGAIKMAVARLRRRYQELFRETIAQTVAQPREVAEEMRHLVAVLGT